MKQPLFFLLVSLPVLVWGQTPTRELVSNGSLEAYSQCPTQSGQVEYAIGWRSIEGTSSDYCHACSPDQSISMPYNQWGYQQARTGQGYAHLILYDPWLTTLPGEEPRSTHREYMQTRLIQPLVAGKQYQVSFYVSLSERSFYALDQIGVYFSQESALDLLDRPGNTIPVPQVVSPVGQVLVDSTGWMRIEGSYQAKGGEQYLTLGRFASYNQLTIQVLDPRAESGRFGAATYYIDDISVIDLCADSYVNLGYDRPICPDERVVLDAGAGFAQYRWQDGSTRRFFTATSPGTYWVEVQGICNSSTDTIVLRKEYPPQVSLGKDTVLCEGQQLLLNATYRGAFYRWGADQWPSNGVFTTDSVQVITQPGKYWVEVANSCGNTVDTILVLDDCDLFIPNVITPNGDGSNDYWHIQNLGQESWQLQISNQWGKIIYSAFPYKNNWEAISLPNGIYYYVLTTRNRRYKGWVHVLR